MDIDVSIHSFVSKTWFKFEGMMNIQDFLDIYHVS